MMIKQQQFAKNAEYREWAKFRPAANSYRLICGLLSLFGLWMSENTKNHNHNFLKKSKCLVLSN